MNNVNKNITLHQKTYIWSIIFEPLLFFVLIEAQNFIAIPFTVSRLLQLCVLLIFFFKTIYLFKIVIIKNSFSNFIILSFFNLTIYIILISILGLLSSHYSYKELADFWTGSRVYEGILGQKNLRPAFEIFLFIYYFIYFVLIPQYVFKTSHHLNYFLKTFFRVAIIVIFLGILDSLSNIIFNIDLIPRHLVDNRWVHMMWRFHSLCGEPRDAVVYLVFLLAIYSLYCSINKKYISKKKILLIMICIILTQSVSGYVGIFLGLLGLSFLRLSVKNLFITLVSISLFILILLNLLELNAFHRISNAYTAILMVPQYLETNSALPKIILPQGPDIIPLWIIWLKINTFDLFHVIFGHGFGSASFAINNFSNYFAGLNNPRSNLVRYLFEIGLFGTLIYTFIFFKPLYKIKSIFSKAYYNQIFFSSVLLFSASLTHRSNLFLIFVGIILSIIINKNIIKNK